MSIIVSLKKLGASSTSKTVDLFVSAVKKMGALNIVGASIFAEDRKAEIGRGRGRNFVEIKIGDTVYLTGATKAAEIALLAGVPYTFGDEKNRLHLKDSDGDRFVSFETFASKEIMSKIRSGVSVSMSELGDKAVIADAPAEKKA